MLQSFEQYIHKHRLLTKQNNLLVAVSGGVDSMVLCDLLLKAGYMFSVAHCNFQLRGEEANGDEELVKEFCVLNNIPFFIKKFNTAEYAAEKNISIQMAARDLRYNWFSELMIEHKFDKLLTAHHLNDNIETFFINLIRGSGVNGLKGILPENKGIIRPLLFAKRNDIEAYATENKVKYRNDSSNASDKYLRNYLRLNIIPKFKELNPSFEDTMEAELSRLRDLQGLLNRTIEQEKKDCVKKENGFVKFDIERIKKSEIPSLLLFELLKNYGFSSALVQNIENCLDAESGKIFRSDDFQITKDRKFLILSELKKDLAQESKFLIEEMNAIIDKPLKLKLHQKSNFEITNNKNKIGLDADKLVFPLSIELWKKADKFMPLGMNGFKKLSDFFTNEKMSLPEKERQWLLKSKGDIVWVIGRRIDERYKITEETKHVLEIEYFPE